MMIQEIEVRLRNDLSEIAPLARALDRFAAETGLPERALFRLHLAVDELLNNTVGHGYPDGRPGEIVLRLVHDGDRLAVVISDDGDRFDPFSAAPPDLTASVEERRVGGVGVHLVRALADAFSYRWDEQSARNVVSLELGLASDRRSDDLDR